MKKIGLLLVFALCLRAQLPVPLGSTGSFAVLGGSTVTNTGNTIVNGNLGVSAGTAVTGFGPGIVTGGAIHAADSVASLAQSDLTAAYNNAAGRVCPGPPLGGDIGGTTLTPGVYCSIPSSSLGITGTLTLSGNGVFIIQVGTTLTTANNSAVNLIGGAQASNVFWQVGSSATLGTTTVFNGTIMALASVTVNTGAVLNGRALARNGAVTLAGNVITAPGPAGGGAGTPSVTCSFPSGQVGVAYSSFLVGTGGTSPYTYAITGGSLPTGLLLNASTGAITGTPTAAGAFSDTSRVTDSANVSSTSSCGITIAPVLSATLSLTCAANFGQVGQPYVSSLVASGGTPPYTYSITSGSLPPGLTLSPSTGAISGTPTAAGSFPYTAGVVDSAGLLATASNRARSGPGKRKSLAASASATSSCGPLIVTSAPPASVPAPPSLILVILGLALTTVYLKREELLARFRRS